MANPDDIYREVMILKKDVEAVKHQTSWILRGQAETVAPHWQHFFGMSKGKKRNYTKMRVYLAVNGRRTIKEIAEEASCDQADVSRWLKEMDGRIVELLTVNRRTSVYQQTPADWALDISASLVRELANKSESERAKP